MSSYTWLIIKVNNGCGHLHTMGPRGTTLTPEQVKADRSAKKFRMKDDDGEVYVEGLIVGDYEGFEPLDDYGTPSLGCNTIEYKEGRKWEQL